MGATAQRPATTAATVTAAWAMLVAGSLVWLPGIDVARVAAFAIVAVAIIIAPERNQLRALSADRVFVAIVGVSLFIVAVLFVADLLRSEPSFRQGNDVRLAQLIVVFIAGRALFAVSRPESGSRSIGWLVTATILGILGVLFARAGINPASVFADAVSEGRFQPILGAFRRIHENVAEGATSTVRHAEIRAMLVASMIGLALLGPGRRSSTILATSSLVVSSGVAFLVFTRANLLAVAITVIPLLIWALRRMRMRWRLSLVAAIAAVVLAALQVGAVWDAIGDRSTQSSELRSSRLERALSLLDDGAIRGVPAVLPDGSFVASPHNMVLDLWMGGGALAGMGGAVLLVLTVAMMVQAGRRVLAASSVEQVAAATGVFGLLAVVLVRMSTGGDGLLDPITWFGFGAALALRSRSDTEFGGAFAHDEPSTHAAPAK